MPVSALKKKKKKHEDQTVWSTDVYKEFQIPDQPGLHRDLVSKLKKNK